MALQFGLRLPQDLAAIPGYAQRAEAMGFDYLSCGEHMMFYGPTANAFIALAVAAGATNRIKLVSSITLLPLYPPMLAAKQTAVLDAASGGRFTLGVGIGGEYPKEFEAIGVPVHQRGARTTEALEIVTRLLTEEKVSFDGKFNKFTDVSIRPRAAQRPRPPIWVAGRKEPAMRRAARYADAWLPYMYTPDQVRQSLETVQRYAAEYGRDPSSIAGAMLVFLAVYPDGEKAKREAAAFVGNTYQQDFTKLVDRYLIAGTPAQCAARIKDYAAAGCETFLITPACPEADEGDVLRMLCEEVIPAART